MTDSLRNRVHKRHGGYVPNSRGQRHDSIVWVRRNTLMSCREQLGDKITTSRLRYKSWNESNILSSQMYGRLNT